MALSVPKTNDSLSQASWSELQSTRSVAEAHQVPRDCEGRGLSHVKHFLLSEAVPPFYLSQSNFLPFVTLFSSVPTMCQRLH